MISIGPKKPNFDDYFPSNEDDDDHGDDNLGLISNLKKLYEKDGIKDEPSKDILQPQIPDVLKPKFTPEVMLSGEAFWNQNSQNTQFGYQNSTPYLDMMSAHTLAPPNSHFGRSHSPQTYASYVYFRLTVNYSGDIFTKPTEFPTQPAHINIHRSHSSGGKLRAIKLLPLCFAQFTCL